MKKQSWRERLLHSTRGQVLALLRTKARTVNDLAAALKVTDNAVRAHLISLERDGLIERHGMQPGVRKPHVSYGLAHAAEQIFPKAYGPLLKHFVTVVSKRLTLRELNTSMREVGRAIAKEYLDDLPEKKRSERLAAALEVLKELGGAATIHKENGTQIIRSRNCPLAAVTAHHPAACLIAESLLTELIGVPVKEHCTKGDPPFCCFEIG
jgi:predicted ArsR family transcriptional regulator